MAHMIDMTTGRAGMAYVGETPWHGLGQQLTEDAPLEVWAREAGLAWEVRRSMVRYDSGDGNLAGMPGRQVLYRSDTRAALSVVSDDYKIVQPSEVLEFYRDLVGAAGFALETAGSLFDGKRIWALARTGDELRLKGQDHIRGYLLLATSCDGSLATTAKFTSVRVVCNNTLIASGVYSVQKGDEGAVKIPHSRKFDPSEVKSRLGLVHTTWAEFSAIAEHLADRRVTMGEAQRWLIDTFGDPSKPMDQQETGPARLMAKVWDSVRNSPGASLTSANGTAWGLVNGVTHYFDHSRNTRTNDARFDKGQFGDGAMMKSKAMQSAIKLLAA